MGEEAEAYTVEVMDTAVQRALANKGALGRYCNSLMLNKALFDGLPEQPPAPLEDIIDSAVKTGADLSQVVAWNYANSRDSGGRRAHPGCPAQRLSLDRTAENGRPAPDFPPTTGWMRRWRALKGILRR
ncbi:MAG: hypothetical protein IPJ94_29800 [Chloroflexi bacterium]|nr:hypothetical protein [Chloroflexota bacterium]